MWDDDAETIRRGLAELERICQEFAEQFGAGDQFVRDLRAQIARELARITARE